MKWVVRIVQGLLAVGFLMAGLSKLFAGAEQIREQFTAPLGVGVGFMYAIGAVETASALALIAGYRMPRAAWGAAAALTVIMIGAVALTLIAGLASQVGMPLLYLALLLVFLAGKRVERNARRVSSGHASGTM